MHHILYGGRFDPPHLGHQTIIRDARMTFPESVIRIIPAASSEYRIPKMPVASDQHRLSMLASIAADDSNIVIDPIELDRGPPTYFKDTLDILKNRYPDQIFVMLLGMDSFAKLNEWHGFQDFVKTIAFWIYPRSGFHEPVSPEITETFTARYDDPKQLKHACYGFSTAQAPRIAATELRSGEYDFNAHVDPRIAAYIRMHQLYVASQA